jgi:hypothetical protein
LAEHFDPVDAGVVGLVEEIEVEQAIGDIT